MSLLKCSDPDGCPCLAHVDTRWFVPCCPHCSVPLVTTDPPEPNHGVCPQTHCPRRGRMLPAVEWRWVHQDIFAAEDLPPINGWEPLELDLETP